MTSSSTSTSLAGNERMAMAVLGTNARPQSSIIRNENEKMALAVFVSCARPTRLAVEHNLVSRLKDRLQVPELVWATSVRAVQKVSGWGKRLEKWTLPNILQGDRITTILKLASETSPEVTQIRQVVRSWADSANDLEGPACKQCGIGVCEGLECEGCGKVWHFGCAWLHNEWKRRRAPHQSIDGVGTHGGQIGQGALQQP